MKWEIRITKKYDAGFVVAISFSDRNSLLYVKRPWLSSWSILEAAGVDVDAE